MDYIERVVVVVVSIESIQYCKFPSFLPQAPYLDKSIQEATFHSHSTPVPKNTPSFDLQLEYL